MRWGVILAAVGVLAGVSPVVAQQPAAPSPPAARDADLRASAARRLAEWRRGQPHAALVAVLIGPGSELTLVDGDVDFGVGPQPAAADLLFEIGSITKAFTGVLLATLVVEQRVALDDPANKWLPADLQLPEPPGGPVTLLDLATHSSGLPVEPPLLGLSALLSGSADAPYAKYDRRALHETTTALKLTRPRGERYAYSNLGVGLLGHALAEAAGAPSYEEALRVRVLEPLAMPSTVIRTPEAARLAPPHRATGAPTPPWEFATLEACGGLRSNAADLATFVRANLHPGETSLAEPLRLAQQVHRKFADPDLEMGLGWHWIPVPGGAQRVLFHNGGTFGSRSFLACDFETGRGVVVLANSGESVDALGLSLLTDDGDSRAAGPGTTK